MVCPIRLVVVCAYLATSLVYANSSLLPVWDAETPVFNSLGGSYNAFGSDGCEVILQRDPTVHRGAAGHSLKITYRNVNAASCGFWMHLFKEGTPVPTAGFADMKAFPYLSFWVRDGGKFDDAEVRMADSTWLARDDSKPAGAAARYLSASSSSDGWREVVVPYRDFQLPTPRAAVIALQFAQHTTGVMYMDDVNFKSDASLAPGFSDNHSAPHRELRRAMWLWETTQYLTNADLEQSAFLTLHETGVTDLFLQVPYRKEQTVPSFEIQPELRRFLRMAHNKGIRVHALDGYPEFALREYHEKVLAVVRAVVAFNSSGVTEERFDGVHLDNEPYQIIGFDGPSRLDILQEYLELNQKVAGFLRQEAPDLQFGVDIPFWWDTAGGPDNPCCAVEFNGVKRPAAQQIISLIQNVGIMAYRNFAGGMDGVINHASATVAYASEMKKQAFVGIETFRQPPANVIFIAAMREPEWQALPPGSALLRLSHWRGFPLRAFTDGQQRYIGLSNEPMPNASETFANAIASLKTSLPGPQSSWNLNLSSFQHSFERYGRTSGEWNSVSIGQLGVPDGVSLSVMQNMPAKVTLAGRSREFAGELLEEVRDAFADNPGFTGDAIHSLESYRKLSK